MADITELRTKLNDAVTEGLKLLKKDKQFQEQLRMAVMVFFVGLTVCYACYSLYVEPLEKKYTKLQAELNAIDNSAPLEVTDLLATAYQKLEKERDDLEEQISIRRVQQETIKEKLKYLDDQQRFARVVLSLIPSAPQHLLDSSIQLTQLEPLEREGYNIYPIQLDGGATYADVTAYLRYIETRDEIGAIDRLEIKRPDPQTSSVKTGGLVFSVRVGRIQLGEKI